MGCPYIDSLRRAKSRGPALAAQTAPALAPRLAGLVSWPVARAGLCRRQRRHRRRRALRREETASACAAGAFIAMSRQHGAEFDRPDSVGKIDG